VSREELPERRVILARDYVQIGLVENGGDPSQEGCFIGVENLEAAFEEIRGEPPKIPFGSDNFNGVPHRAFFEVAPDGLCYMIGEPQK
jgi:lactoylglutathione lyase